MLTIPDEIIVSTTDDLSGSEARNKPKILPTGDGRREGEVSFLTLKNRPKNRAAILKKKWEKRMIGFFEETCYYLGP
jgi:hypothetical protein